MLSVLTMIALISILIIAHELGHFFVAKRCGVRVERFGFGLPFGPTLWSKKVGETEYCVHAALFGGYVAFPDDNPDSLIPPDSPERFENKNAWQRFAIAVAGVTVNAVLGWAIMLGVILGWGMPSADVVVADLVSKTAPAAQAGIVSGDRIVAVNNQEVKGYLAGDPAAFVADQIRNNPGAPVTLLLQHGEKSRQVTAVPDSQGHIGIRMTKKLRYVEIKNPLVAGQLSAQFLANFIDLNFKALGNLITGQTDPKELAGPIGIVKTGAQLIDHGGIQQGLMLSAIISAILAVMNLLPIPALDGGHILFILIEALKGSPVRKELQEGLVRVGFVGLLLLMAFVLFNDINNAFINPVPLPR